MAYLRVTGVLPLLLWSAVTSALCFILPSYAVQIPGQTNIYTVVLRFVPAIVALLVPSLLDFIRCEEIVSARKISSVLFPGAVAMVLCSTTLEIIGRIVGVPEVGRNLVLLSAISVVSCTVLRKWPWIVTLSFVMVNWLWGTNLDQSPKSWALLVHPIESTLAFTISIASAVIASCLLSYRIWSLDTKSGVGSSYFESPVLS